MRDRDSIIIDLEFAKPREHSVSLAEKLRLNESVIVKTSKWGLKINLPTLPEDYESSSIKFLKDNCDFINDAFDRVIYNVGFFYHKQCNREFSENLVDALKLVNNLTITISAYEQRN